MELFTLPTLEVAAMGSGPRGAGFRVSAPGAATVAGAAVTDMSWDGRLRRWFGNPAQYPFTVTLADPAGATIATYAKGRENSLGSYLHVTARLADGRTVGEVVQRFPLSGHLAFRDDAGVDVASAGVGPLSAGYRVVAVPDGETEWARCEVAVGRDATRAYRLSFPPEAPVLVRLLVLGHVLVADATLLPQGAQF